MINVIIKWVNKTTIKLDHLITNQPANLSPTPISRDWINSTPAELPPGKFKLLLKIPGKNYRPRNFMIWRWSRKNWKVPLRKKYSSRRNLITSISPSNLSKIMTTPVENIARHPSRVSAPLIPWRSSREINNFMKGWRKKREYWKRRNWLKRNGMKKKRRKWRKKRRGSSNRRRQEKNNKF